MSTARRPTRPRKHVDLALQGGGAHGAFTWGVLDRLLEDERLEIAGVSGASAGAINAVVMAAGLMAGGRGAAREALLAFWTSVGASTRLNPLNGGMFGALFGSAASWTPLGMYMDMASRVLSPYQFNPLNLNPLRQVIEDAVDFDAVRRCDKVDLFIGATHVRTGRLRVFRNAELSVDAVLASACLPTMFQAVEIDGEAYWDGGYSGNPSMSPLIRECHASDTILVQINPIERRGTPRTAREIHNRLNEIAFNSVLLKELHAGALLKHATDPGTGEGAIWAQMRIHRISSDVMLELGYSSKMIAEWAFFCMLRDEGRKAASEFLAAHGKDLGVRSSLDLDALTEGV